MKERGKVKERGKKCTCTLYFRTEDDKDESCLKINNAEYSNTCFVLGRFASLNFKVD